MNRPQCRHVSKGFEATAHAPSRRIQNGRFPHRVGSEVATLSRAFAQYNFERMPLINSPATIWPDSLERYFYELRIALDSCWQASRRVSSARYFSASAAPLSFPIGRNLVGRRGERTKKWGTEGDGRSCLSHGNFARSDVKSCAHENPFFVRRFSCLGFRRVLFLSLLICRRILLGPKYRFIFRFGLHTLDIFVRRSFFSSAV